MLDLWQLSLNRHSYGSSVTVQGKQEYCSFAGGKNAFGFKCVRNLWWNCNAAKQQGLLSLSFCKPWLDLCENLQRAETFSIKNESGCMVWVFFFCIFFCFLILDENVMHEGYVGRHWIDYDETARNNLLPCTVSWSGSPITVTQGGSMSSEPQESVGNIGFSSCLNGFYNTHTGIRQTNPAGNRQESTIIRGSRQKQEENRVEYEKAYTNENQRQFCKDNSRKSP